jgi:peptide/nickel transport system substrate-binding protein
VGILLNKLRVVLIVRRGDDFPVLSGRVNGTGPYRLAEWKRGKSMLLERNDAYWGPRPALPSVRLHLNRSADAALGDLLSGRSRFVQSNSRETEKVLSGEPDVELRRNSSVSVKFLYFDVASVGSPDVAGGRNPFRDPRVRRAVSLAVDRDELVRRLSVPAAPASQLVTPYIFGHDPSRQPLRHDPREARRLLAEAGWQDGLELRVPARALFSEAAEIVAEMLGRVGIRARVSALPEPDWFRAMGSREFAMTISRFGCPTGDASDLFENLLHTRQPEGMAGLANYLGYSDPEVDRLIGLASRTLEMNRRQEILVQATARVMEDLPVVPLYVDQDLYAFRPGVEWKPRNDNFLIASEIARTR